MLVLAACTEAPIEEAAPVVAPPPSTCPTAVPELTQPPRATSSLRAALEDAIGRDSVRVIGWPKGAEVLRNDCGLLEAAAEGPEWRFLPPSLNEDANWTDPEVAKAAADERAASFAGDPLGFADTLFSGEHGCGGLAFDLAGRQAGAERADSTPQIPASVETPIAERAAADAKPGSTAENPGAEHPRRTGPDEVRYPATTASGAAATVVFHVATERGVTTVQGVDLDALVSSARAREEVIVAHELAVLVARLRVAPTLTGLKRLRSYHYWIDKTPCSDVEKSAAETLERSFAAVPPPVRLGEPTAVAADVGYDVRVAITNTSDRPIQSLVVGAWVWEPGDAEPAHGRMCDEVTERVYLYDPLAPGATAVAEQVWDPASRRHALPRRVNVELLHASFEAGAEWLSPRVVNEIPGWCW